MLAMFLTVLPSTRRTTTWRDQKDLEELIHNLWNPNEIPSTLADKTIEFLNKLQLGDELTVVTPKKILLRIHCVDDNWNKPEKETVYHYGILYLPGDEELFIHSILSKTIETDEDFTRSNTIPFSDNFEIDVKACGDEESPWTEAVLFRYGCEQTCSEPEDEYKGEWELETTGHHFTVFVM